MRIAKLLSVLVVLAGIGVLGLAVAPSVSGQVFIQGDGPGRGRQLSVLSGRGAEIGVSIRDVEPSDKAPGGGVVVLEVRSDSPADKAGVKRSDIVVELDGEHVRSARQFTRLVQETAPGRTVKATVVRDGQRKDVQLTPSEGRDGMLFDGQRLRDQLADVERYVSPLHNFNFDFAMPGLQDSRARLGVTVEELTPQLGSYFGAKDGVLVATVSEDSPASRAGLRAGDVITKVNNEPVRSRDDLVRSLRDARDGGDVTIGIVRDKKESTVTVKLDTRRPGRAGRPA